MSNESELLRQCAASGQMDSRQVAAHVEAGEMEACHCEACDPIRVDLDEAGHFHSSNMRMIVCALCGNKRCPHATNHRNACTNSNEPGQPGSSYSAGFAATPLPTYHQQEKPNA